MLKNFWRKKREKYPNKTKWSEERKRHEEKEIGLWKWTWPEKRMKIEIKKEKPNETKEKKKVKEKRIEWQEIHEWKIADVMKRKFSKEEIKKKEEKREFWDYLPFLKSDFYQWPLSGNSITTEIKLLKAWRPLSLFSPSLFLSLFLSLSLSLALSSPWSKNHFSLIWQTFVASKPRFSLNTTLKNSTQHWIP